jgi:uncharacterized protein YjiS (DUF1127 family)
MRFGIISHKPEVIMFVRALNHAMPMASRSLLRRVLAAVTLHRQRHQLGRLDAHMLRDIGLTPAQARHEAARPIWDAPASWVQKQQG